MAKGRRRRATRAQGRSGRSRRAPALVLVAAMGVLLAWVAYTGSQDRFWDDTRAAGHRAYQRGNFDYAQRMYREALQQARELDPDGHRVIQSLVDMSRVYEARGRLDSAALFRAQAQTARQDPGN